MQCSTTVAHRNIYMLLISTDNKFNCISWLFEFLMILIKGIITGIHLVYKNKIVYSDD